jgi:hypothetical protein
LTPHLIAKVYQIWCLLNRGQIKALLLIW